MLRLTGINKYYAVGQHRLHVLRDVDLEVAEGEMVAIMGASGSGKSTLLNILGILDRYDAGEYWLGETLIRDLSESQAARYRNRFIGFVFQSFNLFPHLKVIDNVMLGVTRAHGVGKDEARESAVAILGRFGLEGREEERPRNLSGGQQQRVACARALVNHPEVLLLDEPLGALDLKLRREMQVELKRIQTEVGLTFVHVTHDQEEAMTMADTVAVMNQGRIEQMGPPEVLYDLPKTKFVANFVGQSNMGEGTITGTDGDFLVAEVYGSTVRIRKDRTTVQNGNLVFGVRPEKVKVSRTKPEGIGNDVRGIVKDVSFIGVATSYLLEMPSGTTWSVYEQNLDLDRIDLKPGDEAWMVWDAGHAFGVDLEGEQS